MAVHDYEWKELVEPIMNLYTESTDGSMVETKESALVWQFRDADPDFGSWQAKELLDHLESVLANEPVSVKSGQHIVEVKPQVRRFLQAQFVAVSCYLERRLKCVLLGEDLMWTFTHSFIHSFIHSLTGRQ